MKLLDRHISQAVLLAMIVVLGVVVALDIIFSLVDELGEAGVNYHAGNAVMFVLLTTPTSLYECSLTPLLVVPAWSGCSRFQ